VAAVAAADAGGALSCVASPSSLGIIEEEEEDDDDDDDGRCGNS
jgi:hypothetical protein